MKTQCPKRCTKTKKMIDLNKVDSFEFFDLMTSLVIQHSDTSDFNGGEIRTLCCPYSYKDLLDSKWDGKIPKETPVMCDVGINKDKNVFLFIDDRWEKQ